MNPARGLARDKVASPKDFGGAIHNGMNKKLTLIAAFLFVIPSTASAGLLSWVSQNEGDNYFISSDWSLGKFYDGIKEFPLLTKNEIKEDEKVEKEVIKETSKKPMKVSTTAQPKKIMVVLATAYSSTPDQTDATPFITAWNTRVRDGILAANFLPFGTLVKIPEVFGDKIFVVEDRMHQRYQYRIDVWFPERQMAKEFGIKQIRIEIIS